MIEVVIGAGVVLVATLVAARAHSEGPAPISPADADGMAKVDAAAEAEREGALGVGDVLVIDEEELWLSGLIALSEATPTLKLFCAPRGEDLEFVLELPEAQLPWYRLEPARIDEGRPPSVLPIGPLRFSLERRGLARVAVQGEQLPETRDEASYALYGSAGDHVALVLDFARGPRLALSGRPLARESVDVLPGSLAARSG